MEAPIIMLDEHTDQTTKQLLQRVINKKKKFDKKHINHLVSVWATMIFAILFLLYLYFTVAKPYSYSFAAMFSAFVNDSINLYLLILTVGCYGFMNLLKEKRDKAEKEFHDLRCEIVDRSKDLWKKEEAWKNRHQVFEMMKQNYDINLYHESK